MIFRILIALMLLISINGCVNDSNNYDDNEPIEEDIEEEQEDPELVFKPFVKNIVDEHFSHKKFEDDPEQFFEDLDKPCSGDCSGHTAGYEWAEQKDIDDVDDCSGNSNSFIEGCEAYVETL